MQRMVAPGSIIALLLALAAAPVGAQPSDAAVAAVRSNCRSDFLSLCSGVPRGGQEALACLQRNQASLSAACRQSVAALGPMPGAGPSTGQASAQSRETAERSLAEHCMQHMREMCTGVRPGGGRMMGCLADQRESLSDQCRTALEAARAMR